MGTETSETLRHLRSHLCVVRLGWVRRKNLLLFSSFFHGLIFNSMQITL